MSDIHITNISSCSVACLSFSEWQRSIRGNSAWPPVWPPGLAELGPLQDAILPGLLKIKNRLPFGGIGVRWEERGSQRREVGNTARNHTITYPPGPHTPAGSVTPGAPPLPCISHVKGVKSKVVIVSWLVVTRFSKLCSSFPKTVLIKRVQVCCDSQKPEIMLSGGLAVKRVKENILKGDMFNWFIYAWRAFSVPRKLSSPPKSV